MIIKDQNKQLLTSHLKSELKIFAEAKRALREAAKKKSEAVVWKPQTLIVTSNLITHTDYKCLPLTWVLGKYNPLYITAVHNIYNVVRGKKERHGLKALYMYFRGAKWNRWDYEYMAQCLTSLIRHNYQAEFSEEELRSVKAFTLHSRLDMRPLYKNPPAPHEFFIGTDNIMSQGQWYLFAKQIKLKPHSALP